MSKRTLAILLALLVVARACLVLSLSDVFFYGEELGKGASAKAMLDGFGVEHYKLIYGYHEGGGAFVTHLKILAFLLVGENVLAHKLVALFMTSILLTVGLWFTSEHFGRRAGWIFGLLFVFCPAAFQRCSLMNLGTHFEAMIFIVLILHFTFRIAFEGKETVLKSGPAGSSLPSSSVRDSSIQSSAVGSSSSLRAKRRTLDHIYLGLSAGFGIYFSLQCAPAIACSAVCLFATQRRAIFGRDTLIALGAFAVGALPLWWMMSNVGMAALIVRGHEFGTGTSVAEGLRQLFEPIQMHGTARDWIVLVLYPLVIGAGLVLLWRAARESSSTKDGTASGAATVNRKALVVFGYLALFVFLYLASGLAVGLDHWFFFLRLSALWLMCIVLFAAVSNIDVARSSRVFRTVYAGAFGLLLISGVLDFVGVMKEGRPGEMAANLRVLTTTKGYDYSEYLDKFVSHIDMPEEEKIAVMLHYRDDPELLLPSINHSMFEHSTLPLDDVLAISRRAYGDRWIESLKGLGPYMFTSNGFNLDNELAALALAPAETQQALAEAIGRTGTGLKIDIKHIEKELRAPVPTQWRRAFLRGTGWRLHHLNRLHPERALEYISQQDADVQDPLREGLHAAVAMNTLK